MVDQNKICIGREWSLTSAGDIASFHKPGSFFSCLFKVSVAGIHSRILSSTSSALVAVRNFHVGVSLSYSSQDAGHL